MPFPIILVLLFVSLGALISSTIAMIGERCINRKVLTILGLATLIPILLGLWLFCAINYRDSTIKSGMVYMVDHTPCIKVGDDVIKIAKETGESYNDGDIIKYKLYSDYSCWIWLGTDREYLKRDDNVKQDSAEAN